MYLIYSFLPLEPDVALHLNKFKFLSLKIRCFVSSLVEIGQVVLEKIMRFVNVFSLFPGYLSLKIYLNKLESH